MRGKGNDDNEQRVHMYAHVKGLSCHCGSQQGQSPEVSDQSLFFFLFFFWVAAATHLMSLVPPGLPLKRSTPSKPFVTGEATAQ